MQRTFRSLAVISSRVAAVSSQNVGRFSAVNCVKRIQNPGFSRTFTSTKLAFHAEDENAEPLPLLSQKEIEKATSKFSYFDETEDAETPELAARFTFDGMFIFFL